MGTRISVTTFSLFYLILLAGAVWISPLLFIPSILCYLVVLVLVWVKDGTPADFSRDPVDKL